MTGVNMVVAWNGTSPVQLAGMKLRYCMARSCTGQSRNFEAV